MSLPKNIDQSKSNPPQHSAALDDQLSPTVCARVTGSGRSAIAVVVVRGPNAQDIVRQCFVGARKSRFSRGEIRYGVWSRQTSVQDATVTSTSVQDATETSDSVQDAQVDSVDAGESVVITLRGENHIEIHCHGGTAAITRIIDDLKSCGVTQMEPDQRISNAENLLILEATEVLCRCVTVRLAAIAMDQIRGALQVWAQNLLADLEDGVVDIEFARQEAKSILRSAPLTTSMTKPFQVVLSGPPNVGKSSLLNAMVGFDRSITLHVAGTTRDVLHAETVIDGLPIRLSDTAGIRDSVDSVEKQGVAKARLAAKEADLVLKVSDPSQYAEIDVQPTRRTLVQDQKETRRTLVQDQKETRRPNRVIRVLNKSDLLLGSAPVPCEIATNALTGDGVSELMQRIADRLAGEMPSPGRPAAINDRQADLLGEIARATETNHMTAKLRELLAV